MCGQKFRNLQFETKITETKDPCAYSTPVVNKVGTYNEADNKPNILNKLPILKKLNENTILECSEEQNIQNLLVMNELSKLNKVFFSSERKVPDVKAQDIIPSKINKDSVRHNELQKPNKLFSSTDGKVSKVSQVIIQERNKELARSNQFHELNEQYSLIENKVPEVVEPHEIIVFKENKELVRPHEVKSDSFQELIKNALKLYVNPLFLIICACRSIHFITFTPTVTVIVDFSMDKGLCENDAKFAIGAISIGDLFGRLCLGWITDHGYLSQPKYMLIITVLQGITTAVLPMMYTKTAIFTSLVLFAMLNGSLFIRHNVLLTHYMRKEEQSIALGCVNFLSGLIGFALPVYIGYFRDTMGTYDYLFYINGIIGSIVGFLWAFEPFFVSCVNAERTTQKIPT